jgi:hypothetical protein
METVKDLQNADLEVLFSMMHTAKANINSVIEEVKMMTKRGEKLPILDLCGFSANMTEHILELNNLLLEELAARTDE